MKNIKIILSISSQHLTNILTKILHYFLIRDYLSHICRRFSENDSRS